MINTGLISYIFFLLPTQELYKIMGIFMFNALSKKTGTMVAYFIHTSFFTMQKLNRESGKFCSLHYMPGHITYLVNMLLAYININDQQKILI
jgi:hypothetical protein